MKFPFVSAVLAVTAAGCDLSLGDGEAADAAVPGVPISQPIEGDLDVPELAPGCRVPALSEAFTYTWDAAGALTGSRHVRSDVLVVEHTWTRDAEGRLVRWESERQSGGSTLTLERDAAGAVVGWTRHQDVSDWAMLGSPNTGPFELQVRVTQEENATIFEAEGLLPLDLTGDLPPIIYGDLDPTWERPRFDLATIHLLFRMETGTAEEIALYFEGVEHGRMRQVTERDAEGRVVRIRVDADGDGTDDVVETHTHEPGAEAIEVAGLGEQPRQTLRFDEGGALIERVEAGDHVVRTTFTRGAGFQFEDREVNGELVARTSLFFNDAGHRILKYDDRGPDGAPEWRKRYLYDAAGERLLFDERDANVDGLVDERREYAYDAAGDQVEERVYNPERGDCGSVW